MIQFTASAPDRLAQRRLPYSAQLKPFNFMLAVNVHPDSVTLPLRRAQHWIIAPFERDATRWLALPWRDLYTGALCQVATTGAGAPGVVVAESMTAVVPVSG